MEENLNVTPAPEAVEQQAAEQQPAPQTLTMEEALKMVQSETDKRVTAALAKQRKEYEKRLSLSSLSETERLSAEKDQRIQELTEQLSELAAFKARASVMDELGKRNLPVAFADCIQIDADPERAEDNLKRIGALEAAFRKGVEEGVKAQLAGKGAPATAQITNPTLTREQYLKLSLAEKAALAQTNPELYRQLNQ